MSAPGFEEWPFDHAWFFIPHNPQTKAPGHVKITDQPTGGQTAWDIDVRTFDQIAQNYFQQMDTKVGQPIQMPDGRVLHVAYRALDDDADRMLQRHGQPGPTEPLTLVTTEGVEIPNTPRDYWEQLLVAHLNRRKQEPGVTLDLGNGRQLQVTFEFFDGLCKDFQRRRGDLIAAGLWPELVMVDKGQFEKGPRPVEGRANALGMGAAPMGPAPPGQEGVPAPQAPQPPPPSPAPNMANPGAENQELV